MQSLSSSLQGRTNGIHELLYISGAQIGALALDWEAGNVYFMEQSAPFIGVQAWDRSKRNMYRIMFNSL